MSNEEILANAVLLANHLIAEKEKIIEDLEPKAKYFDEARLGHQARGGHARGRVDLQDIGDSLV